MPGKGAFLVVAGFALVGLQLLRDNIDVWEFLKNSLLGLAFIAAGFNSMYQASKQPRDDGGQDTGLDF